MRNLLPFLMILGACSGGGSDDVDDFNVIDDVVDLDDAALDLEEVTETHAQVGVPKVDVLWVVDNSRSMYEEQTALANNFTAFMSRFDEAKLDYHIAVVTTGYDDDDQRGQFRTAIDRRGDTIRWLDNTISEPARIFREMAEAGIDGPLEEKGRAQIYTALGLFGQSDNFGFMRDDAFLSVIVLSDENDRSGDIPIKNDQFIDWMRTLKDSPEKVSFSSIVGPQGGCGNAEEGTDYLEATTSLGGLSHSICNPAWANLLEALGDKAAGLRSEFVLRDVPEPSTLEARWKEPGEAPVQKTYGLDFEYNRARNSIVFAEDAPPADSVLTIEYVTAESVRASE
ncbi:MAG: hypothetical protein AB8H79_00775 [Myxococcota bacterium]